MNLKFKANQNLIELSQICLALEGEEFEYFFYEGDSQQQKNNIAIHMRLLKRSFPSQVFLSQEHYEHWRDNIIALKNSYVLINDFNYISSKLNLLSDTAKKVSIKSEFITLLQSSNFSLNFIKLKSMIEEAFSSTASIGSPNAFFPTSQEPASLESFGRPEPDTEPHEWSDNPGTSSSESSSRRSSSSRP